MSTKRPTLTEMLMMRKISGGSATKRPTLTEMIAMGRINRIGQGLNLAGQGTEMVVLV